MGCIFNSAGRITHEIPCINIKDDTRAQAKSSSSEFRYLEVFSYKLLGTKFIHQNVSPGGSS
jgi:hypothetical protein